MSAPQAPTPAKLFMSALFRGGPEPADSAEFTAALAALRERFGATDVMSPLWQFDYTSYYFEEMGQPLWRRVFSFERLIRREQLVDIKLFCAELEKRLADTAGRRRVNLDPGLVTRENFILATGKNITHRVYLERGIYADLTLLFKNKRFQPLPWTYPDYASAEMAALLAEMRQRLLEAGRASA